MLKHNQYVLVKSLCKVIYVYIVLVDHNMFYLSVRCYLHQKLSMPFSNVLVKILGLVKKSQLLQLPYTNVYSIGDLLKLTELVFLIDLYI